MKIIVDLEKKTLKMLENERSIFRGEYGADKLILLINKALVNEYPTITALLSNGRKIGPYTTDDAYGTETINDVTYTKAEFTLSKENGFTLSEGQMQITIWMNTITGRKEAIGNVTLNVINTTAFDDGDIIISGDVEGTLVNYRVELENLQGQINNSNVNFNRRIEELENDYTSRQGDEIEGTFDFVDVYDSGTKTLINQYGVKVVLDDIDNEVVASIGVMEYDTPTISAPNIRGKNIYIEEISVEDKLNIDLNGNKLKLSLNGITKETNGVVETYTFPREAGELTTKEYVDEAIDEYHVANKLYVDTRLATLVNSAPETLDTLGEIAEALDNNADIVEVLNQSIVGKADKSYVDELNKIATNEISKKANKTHTNIIENRVKELEQKINGKVATAGIVEDDTLHLLNASVKDDTLYIKGLAVEQNTLLFDDVTFINGMLIINNPLALDSAKYEDGTLVIGG